MVYPRAALIALAALAFAGRFPASAQSVISTHSGTLYFFEGAVFIGDEPVEQKFGKFADIGEGRELRTKDGRAEILLTPGVFLRIKENSAIRLVSNKLADTRVALLDGSAILEVKEIAPNTKVTLSYKNWQMEDAQRGVYRIDTEPAQLEVYRGEVRVCAEGSKDGVTARDGEMLPFAPVLVAERAASLPGDDFKNWAMGRSMAIASDNVTAAGIIDDPSLINPADPSSLAIGGYSYFPLTGIPSLGVSGSPYGASLWPYPSAYGSMYSPYGIYGYPMPAWGIGSRYYLPGGHSYFPPRVGTTVGSTIGGYHPGVGIHPGGGVTTYRPPMVHPSVGATHGTAIHVGGGHR